jgi:hypothetical protein
LPLAAAASCDESLHPTATATHSSALGSKKRRKRPAGKCDMGAFRRAGSRTSSAEAEQLENIALTSNLSQGIKGMRKMRNMGNDLPPSRFRLS